MPRKTSADDAPLQDSDDEANPLNETAAANRPSGARLRMRVNDLMQGHREIILEHRGQDYHLRITATGKLILTK